MSIRCPAGQYSVAGATSADACINYNGLLQQIATLSSQMSSCETCLGVVDEAGTCDASKGCSAGTYYAAGACDAIVLCCLYNSFSAISQPAVDFGCLGVVRLRQWWFFS